jgi:hypothetical protein
MPHGQRAVGIHKWTEMGQIIPRYRIPIRQQAKQTNKIRAVLFSFALEQIEMEA